MLKETDVYHEVLNYHESAADDWTKKFQFKGSESVLNDTCEFLLDSLTACLDLQGIQVMGDIETEIDFLYDIDFFWKTRTFQRNHTKFEGNQKNSIEKCPVCRLG